MLTSLENCHQNIGAFKSITKINQLTCKLQLLCPLYKHPYANSKQVEVKTSDVEEMFFFHILSTLSAINGKIMTSH